MIDIESTIFNTIATVLRNEYGKDNIYVAGEQVDTPAKFPAVTIIEEDNSVVANRRTADSVENAANLMYEVNVYSNLTKGKKSQSKEIMSLIDEEFAKLGFKRTMRTPVDNLQDTTIFRYVARYTGRVIPESYDELTETTTYRIYDN